jgi:DNA polymerase-3 subunit delta'
VTLEALAAQPRAARLLAGALDSGRLAHAYAFIGPAGTGRTTAALQFAGALLCVKAGCGSCRECRLAAARQHPDLHVLVPTLSDPKSKGAPAIRITDIRELERKASLRPAMAARKVFILDDADKMTPDAPQAFLKTLEEPPAHTVLILVLSTPRALPATILSRCQPVRFLPGVDTAAADSVENALALVAEVRAKGAEVMFRKTERIDRAKAEALVDGVWRLCRDLMLAGTGVPAGVLTAPELAEALAREGAAWSTDELVRVVALCRESRDALARNVNARLTIEVLLSRLALRAV